MTQSVKVKLRPSLQVIRPNETAAPADAEGYFASICQSILEAKALEEASADAQSLEFNTTGFGPDVALVGPADGDPEERLRELLSNTINWIPQGDPEHEEEDQVSPDPAPTLLGPSG